MSSLTLPNMLVAADAGKGVQPPSSPLVMTNQALDLGNKLLGIQNTLAQKAAGQDFQAAIGPDGQVDPVAFGNILKTDPQAAFQAIQASQNVLNNVQTRLSNQGLSLGQAIERMKYVGNMTGSLLSSGAPLTRKQVIGKIADSINDGILTPTEAAKEAVQVPDSPQEIKGWVQSKYAAAQNGINALIPHLSLVSTGSKLLTTNLNPLSDNPLTAGQKVTMSLTPGEATTPVTYQGPEGQPITTTREAIAARGDNLPNGSPPIPGAPPSSSSSVAGLTPDQKAAAQNYGNKTSEMGAQVVGSAANLGPQRAALEGVMDEIDSTNPGPLADTFQKIGGIIGQLGLANINSTSATQLMKKGSAQLVVAQVGAGLGVPTDGKMEEVINSIPNISMTPLAAKGAAGQIAGLLNYKQSEAQAWTEYEKTNGASSYPEFQAQWNEEYPTAAVFQFPHLPKEIQARYWNSLSKAQKTQFAYSFKSAEAAGYLASMTNAK